ncbi:MAG: hypothetical protein ABIJ12_02865 [bacterium]
MYSKFNNHKGFILIKLFILVMIIGLNPGCTENRYIESTIESDPSDVVGTLRTIYTLEELYYYRNGAYLEIPHNDSFINLGMRIHEDDLYNYSVELPHQGYIAVATANLDDDETQDTWQINNFGNITNTSNDLVE